MIVSARIVLRLLADLAGLVALSSDVGDPSKRKTYFFVANPYRARRQAKAR
jgi:hypothetical protein